jgi:diadenosine tetraphosphate (Ap4A) HIT family hydrolase
MASPPSQVSQTDGRSPSTAYERLKLFLMNSMSMSHIYQPVMIRTILAGGGAATRRQIASAFLAADLSQLEYYEQITKGYPAQTLKRHGIVDHDRGIYRLHDEAGSLNEWERASLIALCDGKVADYVARRQDAIWRHRAQNFDPIAGTLRYEVLKRARGRCEACGISNEERALQVDHIIPRTKGGSNDLSNLQALCSACNAQKLDRDMTNFHQAHEAYQYRDSLCLFCTFDPSRFVLQNELAVVVNDAFPVTTGHTLIIPRRHVSDQLDLWQPEVNAIRNLELRVVQRLRDGDLTISGFNIGTNSGASAGQTVFHCHLHVIPRRNGDVENPRGGIRGVIPGKQTY